jgi:SHO1 osmosensor
LQLAWVIAFVGSLIADIQDTEDDPFPKYAWWFLVYNLGCIIGVIVVVASDSAVNYHVALVGFLSAIIVMTSSSVNGLIYSDQAPKLAAAAGFMLLAMVAVSTIQSCGGEESSLTYL